MSIKNSLNESLLVSMLRNLLKYIFCYFLQRDTRNPCTILSLFRTYTKTGRMVSKQRILKTDKSREKCVYSITMAAYKTIQTRWSRWQSNGISSCLKGILLGKFRYLNIPLNLSILWIIFNLKKKKILIEIAGLLLLCSAFYFIVSKPIIKSSSKKNCVAWFDTIRIEIPIGGTFVQLK